MLSTILCSYQASVKCIVKPWLQSLFINSKYFSARCLKYTDIIKLSLYIEDHKGYSSKFKSCMKPKFHNTPDDQIRLIGIQSYPHLFAATPKKCSTFPQPLQKMVHNFKRKKFIFSFTSVLQICFVLFSKFKTDWDTKTSILKSFDILKFFAHIFKKNDCRYVFLKGTTIEIISN